MLDDPPRFDLLLYALSQRDTWRTHELPEGMTDDELLRLCDGDCIELRTKEGWLHLKAAHLRPLLNDDRAAYFVRLSALGREMAAAIKRPNDSQLVVTAAQQGDATTEHGGAKTAMAAKLGEANQPLETFISYSHKDEAHRERLETHLALLKRQGVLAIWHDRKILPGERWDEAISRKLDDANIVLLLVSADFLASDPCYEAEMQRALERRQAGTATVIPIIVEPCQWKKAPFGELEALPKDAKAVASWGNQAEAWSDVAAGIERAANAIRPA